MPTACDHNRTQVIARRDGVDYVECLDCREIFEAEDLEPVKVEDDEEEITSQPAPVPALAWKDMHDLSQFRAQFDCIAQRLSARGAIPQLDEFRELDRKRR